MNFTSHRTRPFAKPAELSVCYWNEGSARDKLSAKHVQTILRKYDVVFISEIKDRGDLHFSGYRFFRDKYRHPNRGGICVFIKHYLCVDIKHVDFVRDNSIWIEFIFLKDVVIGGTYIPPRDSLYFEDALFAELQEKVMVKYLDKSVILLGDMNAHLGDYTTLYPSLA